MQKNEGSKVVKWILIAVSVLFAFVFLILPLYTVISVALRNGVGKYFQYITDKDTISAVKLTAKATLSALVVNTFFGLFAAWFLTMFQFKGKKVLTTLIDIPGNGFTRYSRFDIHIGIRQTKRALSLFTASRSKSSVCRTGNYIGNDICNVSVYIKRNYTDT